VAISIVAKSQSLQVLFTPPIIHTNPFVGSFLTLANDGNFYGTTEGGGLYAVPYGGYGTVFKMTPNGTVTTLCSFNGTNAQSPNGGLTLGNDGNLYGTTFWSFSTDGTFFRITTNGALTVLYSNFFGPTGENPYTPLTLGNDGYFYGTTWYGGNNGLGIAFKVSTSGAFTALASFSGSEPNSLVQANDGNFYGTVAGGGLTNNTYPRGAGIVFRMTPSGSMTTLATFNGINGAYPSAGLTVGNDGYLYGTTSGGGSNNYGTVFKMSTSGNLTTLASFAKTNGAYPQANLVLGGDENFYGTTYNGGNLINFGVNDGTIFSITTNGVLTSLISFSGTNGLNPGSIISQPALTLGKDAHFYGQAAGVAFRLLLPPTITVQPQGQTNDAGSNVVLTVNATSLTPLSFQWQKNGTNLVDVGNVSGSSTNALSLANVTYSDTAYYSVIVTNTDGVLTSSIANLFIIDSSLGISSQPQAQSLIVGHTATFNVTCAGEWPLNYQWFYNGTNLLGATNPAFSIQNVFFSNVGNYSVVVSNFYGSVTSSPALLSVLPLSISTPLTLPDGQFQFGFDTATGVNYSVQWSTNLQDWEPFVEIGGVGIPILLTDPNAINSQNKFYRVQLSSP